MSPAPFTLLSKRFTLPFLKEGEALLIPHEDAYGNEFVPEDQRHLEWATGFTGSAGIALIGPDRAILFVDSRYTLQATHQCPDFHIAPLALKAIQEELKKLKKCYADPWLFSHKTWESYAQATSFFPHPLQAKTQPFLSKKLWFSHPIPGLSWQEKIALVCPKDLPFLLTNPESVSWLLNLRGHQIPHVPTVLARAILYPNQTAQVFCDLEYLPQELRDSFEKGGVTFHSHESLLDHLPAAFQADPSSTPHILWKAPTKESPDPCILPRACKNKVEQENIAKCHIWDGVAVTEFLAWLKHDRAQGKIITELEATQALATYRARHPSLRDLSFPTIAGSGPNGAIVHYHATEETNRPLDGCFLIDSGGQYFEGTTDITRTVWIGEGDPPADLRKHYTAVLKGHINLAATRFPKGTAGGFLDAIARRPIWNLGLDYGHGTGHGVGYYLNVHEGPHRISRVSTTVPLEPGMVLSNEPGLYIEGKYGIRIENLMVVEEDEIPGFLRFKTLTLVPYDAALIVWEEVTAEERNWLEKYGQEIEEKIAPFLSAEGKMFLRSNFKS